MWRLIDRLLTRHLERRNAEFEQASRLAAAQEVPNYEQRARETYAQNLQRWIEDGYFIADDE